jgi:hypothetical protein
MVTLRIEFMDGKTVDIDFDKQENSPDEAPVMLTWLPVEEGLMVKAHKVCNRTVYPWRNIRSYTIHNAAADEYRDGAVPHGPRSEEG